MNLHPLWRNHPSLIPALEEVAAHLKACADESPAGIRRDLSRILLNPGKMLRPAFVLLASSWGPKKEGVTEVAAALELLHIASLVHDDVLDGASRRRGMQTLHETIGNKKAVLTGDYLMARAMKLAAGEYKKESLPLILESLDRLCSSEIDQDFNIFKMDIDRARYLERIRGKTAELFGMACLTGAVTGGCDEVLSRRIYELGISFGMAFQIEDDILDYTGDSAALGKEAGRDLRAGIPTLPLIAALESGDPLISRLCRGPLVRLFPGAIRRRVVARGYIAQAEEAAEAHRQEALTILKRLPETEESLIFGKLIGQMRRRKS